MARNTKRIRVNGRLYEAIADRLNDTYLPSRDEIVEDIDDACEDLREAFGEDLTPTAKADRKLADLFGKATIALTDLKDYLMRNYESIPHRL